MPAPKSPFQKRNAGVVFLEKEIEYADHLASSTGLDRSTIINALLRDHRLRKGDPKELLALIYNMSEEPTTAS